LPLDLHVLSTPPAFVLSQDQTLQQKPGKTSRTGPRQKIKLAQNQSMNKLDTLLSSQETPAHHFGPRGPGRGNFHTVRGPARGVKRSARRTPVQPSTVVPGPSGAAAVSRGLTLGRRSGAVWRAARRRRRGESCPPPAEAPSPAGPLVMLPQRSGPFRADGRAPAATRPRRGLSSRGRPRGSACPGAP